ncbi:hypothetical protein [Taklimakanibacter lacteus]|uniref:hypothetical protein n=1 Tax=Taklimakanibacter lacteus TaxID=2268456 RepID=UPI0013C493F0
MNKRLIAAAVLAGLMLSGSGAAYAAADGDCGSAASAPAVPGTANEAEPRRCENESAAEGSAEPPMPDFEPPTSGALPDASMPAEQPEEIPQESSQ